MFTIEQIEAAHDKVKSGADFPDYIKEIKALGVQSFETRVKDSRTGYFGENGFRTESQSQYAELAIADTTDRATFLRQLKRHQQGETDYMEFCEDCDATRVEKWIVELNAYTCIYYDKAGNEILTEEIPH